MLYEERILHITCRMVFSKIQRRENMPVVFDFRTFSNAESQTSEDVADFLFND